MDKTVEVVFLYVFKKSISASLLVKGKDHVEMGLKDVVTRKCMVKNKEAMRQDKVATVK